MIVIALFIGAQLPSRYVRFCPLGIPDTEAVSRGERVEGEELLCLAGYVGQSVCCGRYPRARYGGESGSVEGGEAETRPAVKPRGRGEP